MRVLHVGCGTNPLPDFLAGCDEVRLDIDPSCEPDIVASMTDLGEIGQFGLVYASHCLEHVAPHEVSVVLREFHRVLLDGGGAVVIVPNLRGIEATDKVLYESPAGPISGLDMIYGCARFLKDRPYMAHRCGFVAETLLEAMKAAGFSRVTTEEDSCFNLIGAARK